MQGTKLDRLLRGSTVVMERCPFQCPHGDRCTLGSSEQHPQGGHNMRICSCNEPLVPVFSTKDEAIEYAIREASTDGGSVIVHDSECAGFCGCSCNPTTLVHGAIA